MIPKIGHMKVLLKGAILAIVTAMLVGTIQTIFYAVTMIDAVNTETVAALELVGRA